MSAPNPHSAAVCIEGNAGSGKTTCCSALAVDGRGLFLREYTETLDAGHRASLMRAFEQRTDDDESTIWREAEERRLRACASAKTLRPVLDTSLVSVIAFGLARRKFESSGNVSSTIQCYRDLLREGRIVLPGKFVHLRVSEKVRQARLAKRGSCHPFLARGDVSSYLDDLRANFFERYLPRNCWTSIDASASTPAVATAQVVAALEKLEATPTGDAFLAWLSGLSAPRTVSSTSTTTPSGISHDGQNHPTRSSRHRQLRVQPRTGHRQQP